MQFVQQTLKGNGKNFIASRVTVPALLHLRLTSYKGSLGAYIVPKPSLDVTAVDRLCDALRGPLANLLESYKIQSTFAHFPTQRLIDLILFEILAKFVAPRACLPDGYEIDLPRLGVEGFQVQTRYVLSRLLLMPTKGSKVFAYALKPKGDKDAPPILLFHGTAPYPASGMCQDTLLADFYWRGVGWSVFERDGAKNVIENWLLECKREGLPKAILTGHSLGGTLAMYCAAFLPHIEAVFAYNAPAVNKTSYDAYNARMEKPQVHCCIMRNDIISIFGSHYIGNLYHVACGENPSWLGAAYTVHTMSIFLQKMWKLEEMDVEKFNASWIRRSVWRVQQGSCFFINPALGAIFSLSNMCEGILARRKKLSFAQKTLGFSAVCIGIFSMLGVASRAILPKGSNLA